MQLVSFVFIYVSVETFGKLFVFITSYLLGNLFSFMLMIWDDMINVGVQHVSHVLICLIVEIYSV